MKWIFTLLLLVATPVKALSDVVCEAVTVFKEAGAESLQGQRAVLDVIRHRAKMLRKTSCQVVMQKSQFSFVHKRFKWKLTENMLHKWQIVDRMKPVVSDAYYFNSGKRIRKYIFIRRIGLHNFYSRKT